MANTNKNNKNSKQYLIIGIIALVLVVLSGGSITVGGLISANIVKASLEVNDDGTFVLSAYLGKGEINKSEFTNGCISLTGDSGIIKAEEDGLSFDAENAYVYFTKNTTEYEKFSVEWELYEYGCECLKKLAYPSYSFSVSAANFLALDEFSSFVRKLFRSASACHRILNRCWSFFCNRYIMGNIWYFNSDCSGNFWRLHRQRNLHYCHFGMYGRCCLRRPLLTDFRYHHYGIGWCTM